SGSIQPDAWNVAVPSQAPTGWTSVVAKRSRSPDRRGDAADFTVTTVSTVTGIPDCRRSPEGTARTAPNPRRSSQGTIPAALARNGDGGGIAEASRSALSRVFKEDDFT